MQTASSAPPSSPTAPPAQTTNPAEPKDILLPLPSPKDETVDQDDISLASEELNTSELNYPKDDDNQEENRMHSRVLPQASDEKQAFQGLPTTQKEDRVKAGSLPAADTTPEERSCSFKDVY